MLVMQRTASSAQAAASTALDGETTLQRVATRCVTSLPALERLHIEWYEEDPLPATPFFASLAPLRTCTQLRELHLLRHSERCATFCADEAADGAADGAAHGARPLSEAEAAQLAWAALRSTAASTYNGDASAAEYSGASGVRRMCAAGGRIGGPVAELRACVHYTPRLSRAEAPLWPLEEAPGLLPCCAGLVPVVAKT